MQFDRDEGAIAQLHDTLATQARRFQAPDSKQTLLDLFERNPTRAADFSLELDELHLDFSKNLVTEDALIALAALADASGLRNAIAALTQGKEVNHTEHRAALHTALRAPAGTALSSTPHAPLIDSTLARINEFTLRVRSGEWLGYDGQRITTVVNLGIGGSDLGPAMAVGALADFGTEGPNVVFVSNVDPAHLTRVLAQLAPATTLFIVASKTFTTQETLANAVAARQWLLAATESPEVISQHFVAVSANVEAAVEFGIPADNTFPLWDWVGGRYSLWSAIGLPIALAIGFDKFEELLAGAHAMDHHFATAETRQNLPVVMALLSYWYRRYFDCASTAVVPYSEDLALFPSYLQQLYMESLGKSVDREGRPIQHHTSQVIWGSAGTNGQHSYFQQLHQGTEFTPVEFIVCATASVGDGDQRHAMLMANCLSQSLALMTGDNGDGNPHKKISGNRPSSTIILKQLSPFALGELIALYEHRVFTLSVLWNINAFDQWGVELGKRLSKQVLAAVDGSQSSSHFDDSTRALIAKLRAWKSPRN